MSGVESRLRLHDLRGSAFFAMSDDKVLGMFGITAKRYCDEQMN